MEIPELKKKLYKILMDSNMYNIKKVLDDENILDKDKKESIENIYVDPDLVLKPFDVNNIKFSLDGYCSVKKIIEFYPPSDIPLKLYVLRSVCLVWPVHKIPTFNTYRANRKFKDRIDYLLFGIKQYLDLDKEKRDKSELWQPVRNNSNSRDWINSFADFNRFIDELGYQHLVEKENNNYVVKDYEEGKEITSLDNIPTISKLYLDNLIKRIENCDNKIYDFQNLE